MLKHFVVGKAGPFFIAIYLKVVRAKPERSRFSRAGRGAGGALSGETPTRLSATAEFQIRGRPSSLEFLRFPAVVSHA